MPKKKKAGQWRNLEPMPGREALYQFEVKTKTGWKLLTNLGASSRLALEEFAQKTADDWIKR
jgi:hypothetical protein